jgi:hypothetical protein
MTLCLGVVFEEKLDLMKDDKDTGGCVCLYVMIRKDVEAIFETFYYELSTVISKHV